MRPSASTFKPCSDTTRGESLRIDYGAHHAHPQLCLAFQALGTFLPLAEGAVQNMCIRHDAKNFRIVGFPHQRRCPSIESACPPELSAAKRRASSGGDAANTEWSVADHERIRTSGLIWTLRTLELDRATGTTPVFPAESFCAFEERDNDRVYRPLVTMRRSDLIDEYGGCKARGRKADQPQPGRWYGVDRDTMPRRWSATTWRARPRPLARHRHRLNSLVATLARLRPRCRTRRRSHRRTGRDHR